MESCIHVYKRTVFISQMLWILKIKDRRKKWGKTLKKNHLLSCWSWFSLLNWIGALTLSLLLKLPPRKLEPWCVLWSFFLLRFFCTYLYKSTIRPCMEYCCHVWAGTPISYLELLNKLQKLICRTVGQSLSTSVGSLVQYQNVGFSKHLR